MTWLLTRIVIFLIWLLHFLPLGAIAAVGNAIGSALFWLIPERRHVTRVNLAKCFPQMPERERERLARAHFRAFVRSFIERGILWWSPKARIERLVKIDGLEHLRALAGRPVILFAPHFVGLDVPISRISMDFPVAGMYSRQKDPLVDELLCRGRTRFGGKLILRQHGLRPSIRAIKAGMPYYFLPDLDFGPRGSVFAPFFGVPAATATGLAYIARTTGAAVLPVVTRMLPGSGGYIARVYPPWTGYPSGNDEADARRMLAFIEERVREMPEQYHWLHKRFKTRPPGEKGFY